ncbi:hypothetical protein [Paenibacillus peoriae]|jgi:hypothetical protein|nr:hypothetical protein [Paenibacillus peoriae]
MTEELDNYPLNIPFRLSINNYVIKSHTKGNDKRKLEGQFAADLEESHES